MPAKWRLFLAIFAALLVLFERPLLVSATWQSMSPFQMTKMDAGWGPSWVIRGANWRHHVRQKIVPGTPYDDASGLVNIHAFSTCPDSTPPKRNGLSSSAYHLPQGASLPAIVTAEFSFIISESCLEAQRPYCASLELWLLEGVAPTSQTMLFGNESLTTPIPGYTKSSFLSDSAVWPGSPLIPALEQYKINNNSTVKRSTIAFTVNRPPFKLQFRDRRGACLEVVDASLSVTSCYVGSAKKSLPFGNGTDYDGTTPTPTTPKGTTTLPPIGMTTPSNEDLLSSLDCKCPAGYFRSVYDRCEVCPPNTYADAAHANTYCASCPSRSSAPITGSTICVCDEGAFRAAGEDARTPCTTTPSAPRQLVATYFDVHTVSINWTEPDDFGGRTDIVYQVQCIAGCEDVSVTRKDPTGETRVADIKTRDSLETSFVTIRIYALNGVSAIAGAGYARYFEAVITLRSSDADAAYAHIPDRVFILIGIFGGAGLVAAFFVVYAVLRHYRERHSSRDNRPIIVIASSSEDALEPSKSKLTDDDAHNLEHEGRILVIRNEDLMHQSMSDKEPEISLLSNHGDDAKVPLVEIVSAQRLSGPVSPASTGDTSKMSSSATSDEGSRLVSP